MLAVQRASGQTPPALDIPLMPAGTESLWAAFLQLHEARRVGMGPTPLVWADIDAWQNLHGIRLSSWEIDTLHQLDRAALATAPKPVTPP